MSLKLKCDNSDNRDDSDDSVDSDNNVDSVDSDDGECKTVISFKKMSLKMECH